MRAWWVLLLLCVWACATPAADFARRAAALDLRAERVRGDPFDHATFRTTRPGGRRLHVYLDGDGTPWLAGLPAADPTPRVPLVLGLMARDPNPGLYLGRPCYHGLVHPDCRSDLWTAGRYAEPVVASLAAATRAVLDREGVQEVVWIGYSGGGVLAMLLAERIPETVAVVTVAANLDVAGWARRHGEPALTGSLDPARRPPLGDRVHQRHYAGGRDRIVPPAVTRAGARGAPVEVIPEFDHRCCWIDVWDRLLDQLEQAIARRSR